MLTARSSVNYIHIRDQANNRIPSSLTLLQNLWRLWGVRFINSLYSVGVMEFNANFFDRVLVTGGQLFLDPSTPF